MIYIKGGKNGVPCPLMDEGTSASQASTDVILDSSALIAQINVKDL